MSGAEFLLWVRGPAFDMAMAIFLFGLLLRFLEIFLLGRKTDLSVARGNAMAGGVRTMFTRFLPADKNSFQRSAFTIVAGYVFHIGLLVALFLFVPHIELIKATVGIGWPGLPTPIVDFFTAMTLIALIAVLFHRLTHPVLKFLSTGEDYLVWAVTFIPLLTGYMAYHHLFFEYAWLLGMHILSVEILLIVFPFTKLMHTFTLFLSRWYQGAMAGHKGVQS